MRKTNFLLIGTGIWWVWNNWGLISSFLTFPKMPTDWSDKETVRLFVIALMRSKAALELVKRMQVKWTDAVRERLAKLAEDVIVWDTVWYVLMVSDTQGGGTVKRTLRERVRDRIENRRGAFVTVGSTDIDSEIMELITAVKTIQLVCDKKAVLE